MENMEKKEKGDKKKREAVNRKKQKRVRWMTYIQISNVYITYYWGKEREGERVMWGENTVQKIGT